MFMGKIALQFKSTKMKTIILAVFFFAVARLVIARPVKIHGQLHVDKTQMKDTRGSDVVLRGMSFGWHNFWPRFYNAGVVKTLHDGNEL
jgi:endoglucanase